MNLANGRFQTVGNDIGKGTHDHVPVGQHALMLRRAPPRVFGRAKWTARRSRRIIGCPFSSRSQTSWLRAASSTSAAMLSYLDQVKVRTLARWHLPPNLPPNLTVTLKFKIDLAGSATRVEVVESANRALGNSAVEALRSASPFPAMTGVVRCLAREPVVATFRNPVGAG